LISAVLDDLQGNLAHDWSLAELGRRHGRERSHLGRRFREVVGLSPLAWLARRRCERAAVLLLTTREAIATIGARVGWPDANYFARRFRTEFGQSPSAYRKQLPLPAAPAAGGDWIQW
jgi:AraC family L-rhamnose operon transcriptional activator RhaR